MTLDVIYMLGFIQRISALPTAVRENGGFEFAFFGEGAGGSAVLGGSEPGVLGQLQDIERHCLLGVGPSGGGGGVEGGFLMSSNP